MASREARPDEMRGSGGTRAEPAAASAGLGTARPVSRSVVSVPAVPVIRDVAVGAAALLDLVRGGGVAVLTGAGVSTDSGIPDYRGPSGALRRNHTPMTYQQFTADDAARRRYWARSHAGWRHIDRARPNDGHRALGTLQDAGVLAGLVTQNVDGLHQAGGARSVIELHGSLARVVCVGCGELSARADLDRRLRAANPALDEIDGTAAAAEVNPDGDASLADAELDRFVMVGCLRCAAGPLEPDVVFFGATVPRERVAAAMALVERARVLLVLGSSLTVMSGYRFVLRAAELGIPVAIVNQGPTRGDGRASLIVDAPLGVLLPGLAADLTRS
jgi:NAD-dependent SIR2 family protein deacetylase